MPEKITLSLTENALDFLQCAVAYVNIKDEHDRCIKYGILHLCDGIELLLKCRLHLEHWSLIVANVDRTSSKDLETGDFISVSWQNAISRVEKVVGSDFKKTDKALLGHLRRLRNRIQHFDIDLPKDVAVSVLAQGIHFATNFVEEHLQGQEGHDDFADDIHELHSELAKFSEFVKCRMEGLSNKIEEINQWSRVVPCSKCRQVAMWADSEKATCLFCGYSDDGDYVAEEWVMEFLGVRYKELDTGCIETCPECGAYSCVDVGTIDEGSGSEYFCFSCGVTGQYDHCVICNGLFNASEDVSTCSTCFNRFMDKD